MSPEERAKKGPETFEKTTTDELKERVVAAAASGKAGDQMQE